MAKAVFSIQELCDQIAQQITDDIAFEELPYDDLKSTALVCHTLCISAQSQLFRHVISAARRLAAILSASPHLLRYIRHLSIVAYSEILKPLATIRFPGLAKLCISFIDMELADAEVFLLIRDLIGLPSICEVEIRDLDHTQFTSDHFTSLFETCTRSLGALICHGVCPSSAPFTAGAIRLGHERAQITRMKLHDSPSLGQWLMSPSCTFDFTSLADLEISHGLEARDSAVWAFLTSVRPPITRLSISTGGSNALDLSQFPGLTCLELSPSDHLVISSLKSDNCVERLVFDVSETFWEFHHSGLLSETDALVATFPLPALRDVEVWFNGYDVSDPNSVIAEFPQLNAKGSIVVRVHDRFA
ncbi:hypothetical protein DFH09DRAFT_1179003 [Mycena vulgaris]|nr:hypothetical protein DFH09DRAFT_1179003 [Mycena vulgaris]